MSETHLQQGKTDEDPEALYFIPGYSFVNKPRKSGKEGGVAAYISDKLTYNRRLDLENDELECFWLEIKPMKSSSYLKQIIRKATRICDTTKTLIDIIATNSNATMIHNDVIPTGIGDHDMVGCVRKINSTKFKPRLIKCRDYRKYNPKEMAEDLRK